MYDDGIVNMCKRTADCHDENGNKQSDIIILKSYILN